MTYKEYVSNILSKGDPEPFCPFEPAYCDDAYGRKCYSCDISKKDYEESSRPKLYTALRRHADGTTEVYGYAWGDPWVEQALLMDDIIFNTPEEAKAWWDKKYGSDI